MTKEKATTPKSSNPNSKGNNSTPPCKHELCLHDLLEGGPNGISKLTPSRSNDTCLNTTISELGIDRHILIERELRPHVHHHGGKTRFAWYWLPSQEEALKACELISSLRKDRGVSPLIELEIERLVSQFPPVPAKGAA